MNKSIGLASALAALATASSVHAQLRLIYVDQTAPSGGDGSRWERAFRDLDTALAAVATTDSQHFSQIWVLTAQGTYRPRAHAAGAPGFVISCNSGLISGITLSLQGSFAGLRAANPYARDYVVTPTILTGDALGDDLPGFRNRDDNVGPILTTRTDGYPYTWTVEIDGFQFEGGHAQSYEAGGLNLDGIRRPVVSNCSFHECEGIFGGGLHIWFLSDDFGAAEIRSCVVSNNRSENNGGGILVDGVADVYYSRITDNWCRGNGGGIAARAVGLAQCVVAGNQAIYGGGIFGSAGLRDCLIIANHATVGGGAYLTRGDVAQSTIADNSADYGGGFHLATSSHRLLGSILDRNVARLAGPQLSYSDLPGGIDLQNVLLHGGREAIFAPFSEPVSPLSLVFDCDPRFVNPDGPDHDPSAWADNDYHLAPGSCAIDRGNSGWASGYDLDGRSHRLPRFPGETPIPDLGCYEYRPHCPADLNQDAGVTVEDLLDFFTAYTLGQTLADIDDGSGTNTPDDAITIDDLLYFLARYNAGC